MTHWKRLWCWEGLGAGGEGDDRGWDGWMASWTQWTWVWVNSGSWWWTGRPGVLRFMESQRVGHDWATELKLLCYWFSLEYFLILTRLIGENLIAALIAFLWLLVRFSSVQFSSVTQSCLTLCDPMNRSTPGLPVHHQLREFTQTHVHRVSDAIHKLYQNVAKLKQKNKNTSISLVVNKFIHF